MKWLEDPNTKKKSVSLTLLIWGFAIASLALFFKEGYTAADWAMMTGTVAGLYWSRRSKKLNGE